MRKLASMTTVLTAAGVLLFLTPALPAQDSSGQSGQSGSSTGHTRSRSHSSSEAQSGTNTATSESQSGTTGAGNLSAADQSFMKKAAQDGIAEVKLGELAQEKASSDQVKQFGKRMVDDHSKANDELKKLAGDKGVTLPDQMSAKDQAAYDRLSKLSGAAFDRAYMRDMETDHNKDVAEFERESKRAKDPALKQWAENTLPTLKEHDHMAHQTMSAVRGSETGTSTSSGTSGTTGTTGDTTRKGDRTTTGDQQQRNPR